MYPDSGPEGSMGILGELFVVGVVVSGVAGVGVVAHPDITNIRTSTAIDIFKVIFLIFTYRSRPQLVCANDTLITGCCQHSNREKE